MVAPIPDRAWTTGVRGGTGETTGSRRPLHTRIRFQLSGALLLAVCLPLLLNPNIDWMSLQAVIAFLKADSTVNSAFGTSVTVCAGYYFLRHFASFPGAKATEAIIPTFALAYAALVLAFFFLRLDYSRYQMLASFYMAVIWFYGVYLYAQKRVKPKLALVPGGNTRNITEFGDVTWVRLQAPDISTLNCNAVVADLRADFAPHWERFIAECALKGIPVYHVKQVAESITGRVEIEHLSENNFGSVLPNYFYARLKNILDFLVAVLVLPIVLPVLLVAGLAVKLSSPGPVFFRQRRVGYGGKVFMIYKLRTMADRRTRSDKPEITRDGDPRITRLGAFLRQYRIDELPQIFNILRGEMSWIGPRPEALELSAWYEREIPYYVYRHIVRPGISGWAQVHQGHVAEVSEVTGKLHYDFFYIKNFSPWMDMLIVARTIHTILTGFGAR